MKRQIQEILRRFGQTVTLRQAAGEQTCRAFLQPVEKSGEQAVSEMTPLGALDQRLWLYLGDAAVEAEDRILWNGKTFRVRSSRPWCVGAETLYWWAALERAKEAET